MENLGLQIAEEGFGRGAAVGSANTGLVSGEVLCEVDSAGTGGTGRALEEGIVLADEELAFIDEEEYGPDGLLCFAPTHIRRNASFNSSLPDVFEEDLGEQTELVELLYGKVDEDDFAIEAVFGAEVEVGAEELAEEAAEEAVRHAGEHADDGGAGFGSEVGEFLEPVVSSELEIFLLVLLGGLHFGFFDEGVADRIFLPFGIIGLGNRNWCRGDDVAERREVDIAKADLEEVNGVAEELFDGTLPECAILTVTASLSVCDFKNRGEEVDEVLGVPSSSSRAV